MIDENQSTSGPSASGSAAAHHTGGATRSTRPRSSMPLSYYARFATAEARRFRQGFTRENVTAFLKTLAWTIPITVIIWVYAEQQTSVPMQNVSVKIEVKSSDPGKIATLRGNPEAMITCDLRGPRANIDRFINKMSPVTPLVITVDAPARDSEIPISTLQQIRGSAYFKDMGVDVTECSPATLYVDVDELAEREVSVVAPPNLLSLQGATFTPATVKIKGPARVLDSLAKAGQLSVTADIANLQVLSTPGQHAPITVPLVPFDTASNLSCSTQIVQATLTVKEADEVYDLSRVNVEVQAPDSLTDTFKIKPAEPFLATVKVVGPRDKIALLRNRQVLPIAVMHVETTDDLQSHRPMQLEIRYLPDGVKLAPGENPQMGITGVER